MPAKRLLRVIRVPAQGGKPAKFPPFVLQWSSLLFFEKRTRSSDEHPQQNADGSESTQLEKTQSNDFEHNGFRALFVPALLGR
ncbi:hypothetical protein CDAR_421801 [Caerostris darwini]|uniref:Uncharacterized protein n=1 Tax=Caerostris darwini TaxID=1538125 RepID=A0AAV4VCX1_9ARAC|nr:hypothetical protein CDAR_421801 [Caerostris darwini]